MTKQALSIVSLVLVFLFSIGAAPRQQAAPSLTVLDRNGQPVSQLTDGDLIRLRVQLASAVDQLTSVSFTLDPDRVQVAECTVEKKRDSCQTDPFPTLGWFWTKDRRPSAQRTLRAGSTVAQIQIAPRPVVMVHGFGSSADAWKNYLGPQGYLASTGIHGFAVGDGQAPGRLNLGDLTNPTAKTGTIASNADALRDYIAGVKQRTGAQMVDLVAHSMGNLVSRYYIDRVMQDRDVAQMIMLGPPNLGTHCAYLPSSLGYYLPAALEIRPSYVRGVFNPQITKRHGIPFRIIAGTSIVEQIASPCASVPSDLAIALDSADGISAPVERADVLHTDLNTSSDVFEGFVKPLLQRTAGEFTAEPDPSPPLQPEESLQFTRVFTGHVSPGGSSTQTIHLDQVAVASFALFDPTQSLTVTVHGATGNLITLDPTRNGLVVVKDPETLVYLGYGFNNPKPGPWQVTLEATDATPPGGSDCAITAQVKGGAVLHVQAAPLLPKAGQSVQVTVRLELGGQPLGLRDGLVHIRAPDGHVKEIQMAAAGTELQSIWSPDSPGLYGVDVSVNGNAPDGTGIERSAFVSVEAQPTADQFLLIQLALVLGGGVIAILFAGLILRKMRRAHQN